MNTSCRQATLSALLFMTAISAYAQPATCSLDIRAIDADGKVLPGATVTLLISGSEPALSLTDAEGKARFAALQCDQLRSLEVSFPGFIARKATDIELCEGSPVSVTVCLDEEEITEIVLDDRTNQLLVDINKMRVSNTYSALFLQDLPGHHGDSGERPPKRLKGDHQKCQQPVTVTSSSPTPP